MNRDELNEKGEALRRGLLSECEGDIDDALKRLAMACAWLTSNGQAERNRAKERIREWKKAGDVSHAKPENDKVAP